MRTFSLLVAAAAFVGAVNSQVSKRLRACGREEGWVDWEWSQWLCPPFHAPRMDTLTCVCGGRREAHVRGVWVVWLVALPLPPCQLQPS